jgi:hypothetical protein
MITKSKWGSAIETDRELRTCYRISVVDRADCQLQAQVLP